MRPTEDRILRIIQENADDNGEIGTIHLHERLRREHFSQKDIVLSLQSLHEKGCIQSRFPLGHPRRLCEGVLVRLISLTPEGERYIWNHAPVDTSFWKRNFQAMLLVGLMLSLVELAEFTDPRYGFLEIGASIAAFAQGLLVCRWAMPKRFGIRLF